MKFLCLIYHSADIDDTLTDREIYELVAEHFAYDEGLEQDGTLIVSEALERQDKAVVIRPRDQTLSVTDGPFLETKEYLAGFYLVDAVDMTAAIEIARRIPSARYGAVEIRPIRTLTLPSIP
jgi:hypothetical protein